MGMTANDVQNVRFSRPPIGKRGYDEQQVDELLDLIEGELTRRADNPASPRQLTGAVVRESAFARPRFGKRGYNEAEVDLFLDRAAAALDAAPERRVADPVRTADPLDQTRLYASPDTVQRVIAMIQAESDVLARSSKAAEASITAPSVVIYTVD